MLMQAFKPAADLGITEPQKAALMKTLVLLETGKLTHVPNPSFRDFGSKRFTGHFNMRAWSMEMEGDCGTVRCIGGTAEIVGKVDFGDWCDGRNPGLYNLFSPTVRLRDWDEITDAHAATALRSYLTTGDARWDLAVA